MIKLEKDMSIEAWGASLSGILHAVESPAFRGDFVNWVTDTLHDRFMEDTIASHMSGNPTIQHVFEWNKQDGRGVSTGQPNPEPLFKVMTIGAKGEAVMTYEFLPSSSYVPLPDPARYGFSEKKLAFLKRHTFVMKALVMETHSMVAIKPRKKLFIPTTESRKGYVMTPATSYVNPGGAQATGGFAAWWEMWFATVAQGHIDMKIGLAEEVIKKTGQKVVRDAATGRFAKAKTYSIGVMSSAEATASAQMLAAGKRAFR